MRGRHIREDIGMAVALYAGSQRSSATAPGRVTRHSFSFGEHYDPANLGFGPLVCHNDDVLDPSDRYLGTVVGDRLLARTARQPRAIPARVPEPQRPVGPPDIDRAMALPPPNGFTDVAVQRLLGN